jgi:hypothetical protein
VRDVEAPAQVLESRARHGQPDALADLRQGERRDGALQDGVGILETTRGRLRMGERRQQLPPAGRRAVGQQPQRILVPTRRGRRRPGAHARCRARQHRHGVLVPGVRRDGDVMRVGLRRRSALQQGCRRPAVRRDPPARTRRVVDRAADEGMAHREAPRPWVRSHQTHGCELVERPQRVAFVDVRDRGDRVGLEVHADDRGGIQHDADAGAQRAALLGERDGDGVGDTGELRVDARAWQRRVPVDVPCEVLEVERVAPALQVQEVACPVGHVAEERRRRREIQRCEDQLGGAPFAQRPREGDVEAFGRLVLPQRERKEHLRRGRAAQQRRDEVDGRRVGPVQVVEDHDERPIGRERREQRAHGGVHAVAFRHRGARIACEGRQRLGQRRRITLGQAGRRRRREVRLKRVDPDGERQVRLVLRGTTRHDDGAPVGRPEPELVQQPRLADARLAGHDERGRAAGPEIVEDPVEDADLRVPTDQRRLGAMAHRATIGPSARRDPLTGARRPGPRGR